MKIMTKEEVRKEAEAKCLELSKNGFYTRLQEYKNRFSVERCDYVKTFEFPFTDLKNGDLCICKDSQFDASPYYFLDGSFYISYCVGFQDKNRFAKLITKTGFNILDYLEGEK